MLEENVENRLTKEVKKRGGKAPKFVSPGLRGMPDRIVLLPGARTIFVELKKPGETRDPLQIKRAQELEALGYEVYCLDSYEAIDRFVTEVFGT